MKHFFVILAFVLPLFFASQHASAFEMMSDAALHRTIGQAGTLIYIDNGIKIFWVDPETYGETIDAIPSGIEGMQGGVFERRKILVDAGRWSLLRDMRSYNTGRDGNILIGRLTVEIDIIPVDYILGRGKAGASNSRTVSSEDEVVSVQYILGGRMEIEIH